MFEVGSLLFVERSIIGGITNMQSTISSGLTQQVWGSQCWHSIKNSELNTSDYELTEKNKAKIDECLKERQEAMDARIGQDGYNAQISKINRQSAKL